MSENESKTSELLNVDDLIKIAESPLKSEEVDFSSNVVEKKATIKYLRDIMHEFSIRHGFINGQTLVRPIFLFDYLINWANENSLISKYQRVKFNKTMHTWFAKELKLVYKLDYFKDTLYDYPCFSMDVEAMEEFKNKINTEYNPYSLLMMRKYKELYDNKKRQKSKEIDKVLKEEISQKEKARKQILEKAKAVSGPKLHAEGTERTS
jgi:hypothetical protein